MSNDKHRAIARVQVTVEFPIGGVVWGPDCTLDQVTKQAWEGALSILRRGLVIQGLTIGEDKSLKTVAEIVGEPKITAILVEKL